MDGLTTYQDPTIREDLKRQRIQKPKPFDKKAYWAMKRVKKPKSKKRK